MHTNTQCGIVHMLDLLNWPSKRMYRVNVTFCVMGEYSVWFCVSVCADIQKNSMELKCWRKWQRMSFIRGCGKRQHDDNFNGLKNKRLFSQIGFFIHSSFYTLSYIVHRAHSVSHSLPDNMNSSINNMLMACIQ